jgi:alkyl hydroperoxide reductase subunit F
MYDVVIVGGGPAGLTATVYCLRKRLETRLISETLGGKTNFQLQLPFVERQPLINGAETVDRFSRELAALKFVHASDLVDQV